jgi:hypothetical protein
MLDMQRLRVEPLLQQVRVLAEAGCVIRGGGGGGGTSRPTQEYHEKIVTIDFFAANH